MTICVTTFANSIREALLFCPEAPPEPIKPCLITSNKFDGDSNYDLPCSQPGSLVFLLLTSWAAGHQPHIFSGPYYRLLWVPPDYFQPRENCNNQAFQFFGFLIFHLWNYDKFQCLRWNAGRQPGAFKRVMTVCPHQVPD